MVTTRGTEAELLVMLESLIELDYDAMLAYDAAIARLRDEALRAPLRAFRADHHRHAWELSVQMRALGRGPPTAGDLAGVLAQGRVVLATLAGDRGVLLELCSAEDDTAQAYAQALQHKDIQDTSLLLLLQRSQDDGRRHRAWLVAKLLQPGEGAATSPIQP